MSGVPGLCLYRGFGRMLEPFAPFYLRGRQRRDKEDAGRLPERLGHASLPRPSGPLVWMHAASIGESVAVLPLASAIAARSIPVLMTSGTVTAARVVASRLPDGVIHHYAPLDLPGAIDRFLAHWRPDLALFVESELWPGAIGALAERRTPLVLVNARMSARSFARWRRVRGLAAGMLRTVALCLAQSAANGERYAALGAPRVIITGNLKFDVPAPSCDPEALALMQATIGRRPVLLVASTHAGEDGLIAAMLRPVLKRHPDVVAIVAPRHPQRGAEVAALFATSGLVVSRRSEGAMPAGNGAVHIADTVGELGLFYRVATVVVLGGAFVDKGGQNPIEPALLGHGVLHGPHVRNFDELYAALDEAGGAIELADADALVAAVTRLLDDPAAREAMANAARRTVHGFSGALTRTIAALDPFLDRLTAKGG